MPRIVKLGLKNEIDTWDFQNAGLFLKEQLLEEKNYWLILYKLQIISFMHYTKNIRIN